MRERNQKKESETKNDDEKMFNIRNRELRLPINRIHGTRNGIIIMIIDLKRENRAY